MYNHFNFADSPLGGDFGVALSSSLFITGSLQYMIRQAAEMEMWMTSVKRIMEYGQLKSEDDEKVIKSHPPKNWPENGRIEFQNVSLNYDQENLALNGVTFGAKSGEKVFIVHINNKFNDVLCVHVHGSDI